MKLEVHFGAIEVHIHTEVPQATEQALGEIVTTLQRMESKMSEMSDAIAALETEVNETKAGVDSAIVFIQGIVEQLNANAGNAVKVRELAALLDSTQVALAAAVANPGPNPAPPA